MHTTSTFFSPSILSQLFSFTNYNSVQSKTLKTRNIYEKKMATKNKRNAKGRGKNENEKQSRGKITDLKYTSFSNEGRSWKGLTESEETLERASSGDGRSANFRRKRPIYRRRLRLLKRVSFFQERRDPLLVKKYREISAARVFSRPVAAPPPSILIFDPWLWDFFLISWVSGNAIIRR